MRTLALVLFLSLPLSAQTMVMTGGHRKIFSSSPSVTPGFVSGRLSSGMSTAFGTQSYSGCPSDTLCFALPYPSLAGNLITVDFEYSSTPSSTFTITTDQSQTLTIAVTTATAESSRLAAAAYLCNATTGTRMVEIAASAAVTVDEVLINEYAGVASSSCLDASSSNGGASATTVTAGSLTPTQSGDLLETVGYRAGTPACTTDPCFVVGSQSNITWILRGTDYRDGGAFQYGFYNSTSAINPQFTLATASTFLATTMAFKVDSTKGTNPSGMYVVYEGAFNTPATAASTQKVQFPSTGNLLVSQQNCGGPSVTSITDATNTWYKPSLSVTIPQNTNPGSLAGYYGDLLYASNAVANATGAITFNLNIAPFDNDCTFMMYDIAGAAANPLASNLIAAGFQTTTTGSLTFAPGFQPEMTDGLVLATVSQQQNTSYGQSSPSGVWFESSTYGGQSRDGPSLPDQNNYWGVLHNSSATAQTWTQTFIDSAEQALWYGATIASFLSATGSFSGPSIVNNPAPVAVGTSGSTLSVTIPASLSGTGLIAVIGSYNSTYRTITKVCTNGTSCTGSDSNSFTCVAAANNGGNGNSTAICYLFGHAAGVTNVEVTYSGSITNSEMKVLEVRNISTLDTSGSITSGTGSGNVNTGASVTTTGSPDFIVSVIGTNGGTIVNPSSGDTTVAPNNFGYDDTIFANTSDAEGALIAPAGTYSYKTGDSSSTASFCNSTAAFK